MKLCLCLPEDLSEEVSLLCLPCLMTLCLCLPENLCEEVNLLCLPCLMTLCLCLPEDLCEEVSHLCLPCLMTLCHYLPEDLSEEVGLLRLLLFGDVLPLCDVGLVVFVESQQLLIGWPPEYGGVHLCICHSCLHYVKSSTSKC